MKKILLNLAALALASSAIAQNYKTDSTGFYANFTKGSNSDVKCVTEFKGGTNGLGAFSGGNVKSFV